LRGTIAGTIAEYETNLSTHHPIDIARRLGISTSTVSRALSDHPDVDSETKKKSEETC